MAVINSKFVHFRLKYQTTSISHMHKITLVNWDSGDGGRVDQSVTVTMVRTLKKIKSPFEHYLFLNSTVPNPGYFKLGQLGLRVDQVRSKKASLLMFSQTISADKKAFNFSAPTSLITVFLLCPTMHAAPH